MPLIVFNSYKYHFMIYLFYFYVKIYIFYKTVKKYYIVINNTTVHC